MWGPERGGGCYGSALPAEVRLRSSFAMTVVAPLLALLLAPLAASAAGLGVPDLGAASLGQGAATIAAPDDPYALYYNPAALAGHPGLRLLLDGRGIQHAVTFQRLQADGSNPDDFASVSNGGPSSRR